MYRKNERAVALLERLRVEGVAKVSDRAALDAFLACRDIDTTALLRDAWIARWQDSVLAAHECAVEYVLRLHAPDEPLRENGVTPATLAGWINAIRRDLGPGDGLCGHLAAGARALGTVRVQRALEDPEQLLDVIKGADLRLDGNEIRAEYLDPVPLRAFMTCLRGDGRALWRLREMLSTSSDILDLAIVSDWSELRDGVAAGMLALFDRADDSPTPAAYLLAFPLAAEDPALLSRVMREFARRVPCVNGFDRGPDLGEWLAGLAHFRCWAKTDLRHLAYMDDLLASHPDAFLATSLAAVEDAWDRDRATAAFCALTLIRAARCVSAVTRKLEDHAREDVCRQSLAAHEGGEDLLRVADLCRDLPLGLRNERHVWSGLTDAIKAHWIRRVASEAERSRALGDGLVAFVLTWSSKDTYADIEPLVLRLQTTYDRRDLLLDLAAQPGHVAASRARYLLDEFDIHPPARRLA